MRWLTNATRILIEQRRNYQHLFCRTPMQRQYRIWRNISRELRNRIGFVAHEDQCRSKWNALKSGYENLERLINGNPNDYPTYTPTLDDEHFHSDLSDEFWLVERNYFHLLTDFFINCIYIN